MTSPLGVERPARLAALVSAAPGRRRQVTHSPFDGSGIGEVPTCTADDVAAAVARARAAQRGWAARPLRERAAVARRYHDLVLARQDELLDLIQVESGKSRASAHEEVADVAANALYYARTAGRHLRTRRREGAVPLLTTTVVHHRPRGVVGVISPWNYPFTLAVSDAVPALVAGNAVVLKPDRQTPFTALAAVELLREAGLPPDLFHVVTGEGTVLGPSLIDAVDFVMFTGSTAVGRVVAEQCGRRLIGFSAELGGKNPMIVLADSDVEDDAVAKGARVLAGGRERPDLGPLFFEPTVLEGVTEDMEVARAETFGPVVSLYRVRDAAEAVARANDSEYGLNAAVWSTSRRGAAVAARLQVGTANVNEGYAATWSSYDAPMGGWKASGVGRRHGREGIVKYTEAQTVAVQRLMRIHPPDGVGGQRWAALVTTGVRLLRLRG